MRYQGKSILADGQCSDTMPDRKILKAPSLRPTFCLLLRSHRRGNLPINLRATFM